MGHASKCAQRRRKTPKKSGMRPVKIEAPDTGPPGFGDECRRQSMLVAAADQDLMIFLDAALADLGGDWRS